jgi:hypothetical protein
MPTSEGELFLYEAIELRAEYDARIKTLQSLLDKSLKPTSGGRWMMRQFNEESRTRAVREFDHDEYRHQLQLLTVKRRLLNNEIQRVNYAKENDNTMTLGEMLDLRKATNLRISELSTELTQSAYETVVHKEQRDIVEGPERKFKEVEAELEHERLVFRDLNRALRRAGFEKTVQWRDDT